MGLGTERPSSSISSLLRFNLIKTLVRDEDRLTSCWARHTTAVLTHYLPAHVPREMTLPRGPRPLTNDQVIASHGLPDKRETTKSPVNLIDFDTIIKLGRLGLLEQGNRSLHKDSGA